MQKWFRILIKTFCKKISHGLPCVFRQGVPPVPEPVHEGPHGGVEAKDQDGAGAERKEEVAHGPGGGDVIRGYLNFFKKIPRLWL